MSRKISHVQSQHELHETVRVFPEATHEAIQLHTCPIAEELYAVRADICTVRWLQTNEIFSRSQDAMIHAVHADTKASMRRAGSIDWEV